MPTQLSQDDQTKPASGDRVLLLLPAFLGLVFLYMYFVQPRLFAVYQQTPIHGRVERIVRMEKGQPTVLFHHNPNPQYLGGPQAFGQYLAVGDSVVKEGGTTDISIYRPLGRGFEVSTWRNKELDGAEPTVLSRYHVTK